MDIKTMNVKDLKPWEGNPRKISDEALDGLETSIDRWGMVQPIVWNKRTDRVVGGHQRLKVLQRQNIEETKVIVVDVDESEEMALNISMNNPGTMGVFTDKVNDLLFELKRQDKKLFEELRLQEVKFEKEPITDEIKPEIEFAEYIGETHNYVVLLFDNDIDWLQAQTHFELKHVKSLKTTKRGEPYGVGIGRVIDGAKYLKRIRDDRI